MRKNVIGALIVLILAIIIAVILINVYWYVLVHIAKLILDVLVILAIIGLFFLLRGLGRIRQKLPPAGKD